MSEDIKVRSITTTWGKDEGFDDPIKITPMGTEGPPGYFNFIVAMAKAAKKFKDKNNDSGQE